MTRRARYRLTRRLLTLAVILSLPIATQGCAAMLLGYVVASEINKSKNNENCRANMATVNDARIAKGESPYPVQCGQ